jgi:D-serine deaminase-like pyridoxal phosphate-dependent protein
MTGVCNSSLIGKPVECIDTPALLVDYDILERNILQLQRASDQSGLAVRPHMKAHKTPQIAHMQIRAGAIGLSCAKLGEAEAMAAAGVEDLFIANSLVGTPKMARLVALARQVPRLSVAVESIVSAQQMNDAFTAAGMELQVSIELEIGSGRAGVMPEKAVEFARELQQLPALKLRGIMGYAGGLMYDARTEQGRVASAAEEGRRLSATAETLRDAGFDIQVVSGGGTPTAGRYRRDCGLTEVRCGTYCLNDYNQVDLGACTAVDVAATVLSTVISIPAEDRIICDAGTKALDQAVSDLTEGFGWVKGYEGGNVFRINDEHGYIDRRRLQADLAIGDRVEIYPPRICTCLNLYDFMYVIQDGHVRDIWQITARGANT